MEISLCSCHEAAARAREISRSWRVRVADPRTLRRLSSSASAEEGILNGPTMVRGVGCAPVRGDNTRAALTEVRRR